jgi:fimbrial chaperone protein
MFLASRFRSPLLLPLCLAVVATAPAEAGSLAVSPIRIELPPDGSPEVVHVRNGAVDPTLVQVQAVEWAEDIDAAPAASEIIAVPPVFELKGSSEQVLRLALRRPLAGAKEKAYRLLITEVPREVSAPNALTFAVRLNLPIFVTPDGALPEPEWSVRRSPDGEAELVLDNRGGAHLRVDEIELRADGASTPVYSSDEIAYALAADAKIWALGQPFDGLPPELEVIAESNRGPLVAPVARPGG